MATKPTPAKGAAAPTATTNKSASSPPDKRAELRDKIKEDIERQEQKRERELAKHRLEVARMGAKAYLEKRSGEASKALLTYLKLVEDWKQVSEGALTPSLFDKKKDIGELLTITGAYWDLAKIYDRSKSANKDKKYLHYLEKFILFSQGMSYQAVSAESLRKYVTSGKAMHAGDFKRAYKMIGSGSTCFVATALVDVSRQETLPLLRLFRDEVLERSTAGRMFIRWYYRNGPALAAWVNRLPQPIRVTFGKALDGFARGMSFLFGLGGKRTSLPKN